jgi:hypothetical protein
MMEEERKRQLERMADQQRPPVAGDMTTLHPPGINLFHIPCFLQLGLNEADTIKSSSILIYSNTEQRIYTQIGWLGAMLN